MNVLPAIATFVTGGVLGAVAMGVLSAVPVIELEHRLRHSLETLRQIARSETADPARTAIEALDLDQRLRNPEERRRALDY